MSARWIPGQNRKRLLGGDVPVVLSPPTSGNILVANGTQFNSVPVSGDATISAAGVVTLVARPYAIVRRDVQFTGIVTATPTAVPFDTAEQNPNAMWSIGVPTRLIAPSTGLYSTEAFVNWDTDAASFRVFSRLRINGTTLFAFAEETLVGGTSFPSYTLSGIVVLATNDYVELLVEHTRGSNFQLASGLVDARASLIRIG